MGGPFTHVVVRCHTNYGRLESSLLLPNPVFVGAALPTLID